MTPRYYQTDALNATWDYIRNGGRRGLIVIPTGGGKSYVQVGIIEPAYNEGARILCLTHDQRLIEQNYKEMVDIIPFADAGIYSAGLNSRKTDNQIIFAGIQSVYKKALHLGRFDLIIVDEAHRIPQKAEGTYRKFIDKEFEINPNLVLLGMTATHYRMKGGFLNYGDERIFNDIIHETTILELMDKDDPRNRDNKQYLCKLISKNSATRVDLSGVRIANNGEYNQSEMENVFDGVVEKAVKEILEYTVSRKKVLIFAAGIKHAEHIKSLIPDCGIAHSQCSDEDIGRFKRGEIKYLVNVDMLTTGFNDPRIDCIVLARAILSAGLVVQILGRGTRMAPGKDDCLVLDFGENILRHGTIDKITGSIPRIRTGESTGAPIKECPNCHSLISVNARFCPDCGHVFPELPRHEETASEADIISKRIEPEWCDVSSVEYYRHRKDGKPDSMRVEYMWGYKTIAQEFICLEHGGYATRKALEWIEKMWIYKDFLENDIPSDIDNLIDLSSKSYLKTPSRILVDYNDKFPRILDYEFQPNDG